MKKNKNKGERTKKRERQIRVVFIDEKKAFVKKKITLSSFGDSYFNYKNGRYIIEEEKALFDYSEKNVLPVFIYFVGISSPINPKAFVQDYPKMMEKFGAKSAFSLKEHLESEQIKALARAGGEGEDEKLSKHLLIFAGVILAAVGIAFYSITGEINELYDLLIEQEMLEFEEAGGE